MTRMMTAVRGADQVADVRARAQGRLDRPGQTEARILTRMRAVVVTLDWLTGACALAPFTETVEDPTPDAMLREQLAAEAAEDHLRHTAQPAVWAGVIGQTISWFRCVPATDAPA